MSGPRKNAPDRSPASARRLLRCLRALGLAAVIIAALAGVALWAGFFNTRSSEGYDLGRLPLGVSPGDLNVLLVTLDTTRADRLGPYGFGGVQTPVLDRLAREGVVFEHAASAAPLTQPSHATMFTSRLPPAHGVRDNGVAALADGEVTLAEALKAAGARTGAFVGAYVLDSRWGFDQGFDTYFDEFDLSQHRTISLGGIERRAGDVVDTALKWLDSGDQRFFAWLHFFDAHAPYSPPEPFKSSYAGRGYVGEIAYMDAQLGRVISALESRGLLDRTIVVVVGDHGESLGEHGEGAHGFFLYEGVIRVPLIVRTPYPSARGRRVSALVRTIDLMPTILDLAGLPRPGAATGRSLAGVMSGADSSEPGEAYSESLYPANQFGWSDLKALRAGDYKYIEAPRPELYDLERDPQEKNNLYDERRSVAGRMSSRLAEIQRDAAQAVPQESTAIAVDADTRARLAALGYIGTFVGSARENRESGSLADPKDKIEVFNQINRASELSKHENRGTDAIAILNEVVSTDATVIAAWFMLGNEYVRVGQFEKGIEHYRRALDLKPDYDLAVTNIANAYRMMGRDEDAATGFERLLEVSPRNATARLQLAQIRAEQGRTADAQALIGEALALEPGLSGAHNVLGIIKFKQGDATGAVASIRTALESNPGLRGARFNLALIAEEQGDFAAAIREYQAEIERHPDHYKALFNVGRLYEKVGDRRRQLESFRRAIELNPRFAEGHLFLAKLYLDMNENFDEAARLAKRGMELNPWAEFAPLGHYVLADIYSRRGMPAEARREAERGRAREVAIRARHAARRSSGEAGQ